MPDKIVPPFKDVPTDRVLLVPMDAILSDDNFNVRGRIDMHDTLELAAEIKKNGLIQPITIQPIDGPKAFRIVAGHRRHMAFKLNQEDHIPALVRTGLSDLDARVLNLAENVQRQDLRLDQEARGLRPFHFAGWTDSEIAKKVGKSPYWVRVRLDFLELPGPLQDEVLAGLIKESDIAKLLEARAFGEDAMMAFAKKLKDAKLLNHKTVKDIEKTIKHNEKRIRTQEELFAIQDDIQTISGKPDDLLAIVLGFAAGYVEDSVFYQTVQEYIRDHYDRHFPIPAHATQPLVEA